MAPHAPCRPRRFRSQSGRRKAPKWGAGLVLIVLATAGGQFYERSAGADSPPAGIAVHTIDLAPLTVESGAGGIVAVDLTGDGRRELVVTTPQAIGAYRTSGERLWSTSAAPVLSAQAESQGLPGYHAPGVAFAGLGPAGTTAVLYLGLAGKLEVLNGADGRALASVRLPPPPPGAKRWEHLAVANFRGQGRRDLLLQATDRSSYYFLGRHLAAFALERLLSDGTEAEPLWRRDDFAALPHSGARLADLDGDGRHEVLGGMILRPDGSVAVTLPLPSAHMNHIDAVFAADVRPDLPGLEVVALEEKEANRVFLAGLGGILWSSHHLNQEAQNAAIGDFDRRRPGLEIWARSRYDVDQKPFVFDSSGALIASYQMRHVAPEGWTRKGVEAIAPIHWSGDGGQWAAAKERHGAGDIALFDPLSGRFLQRLKEMAQRLYVADVLGDWREEMVVVSARQIRIYSNAGSNPDPGRRVLWADDHYRQGKTVWNYYNP